MNQGKRFAGLTVLVAGAAFAAPGVQAAVINFDEQFRGTIIDDEYEGSLGVTITAVNGSGTGPDVAAIFQAIDTATDQPDPDLRPPYDGGNAQFLNPAPDKVLIIPVNLVDNNGNGRIDDPRGQPLGGSITFSFDQAQQSFGFDIIDAQKITTSSDGGFSLVFSPAEGDGSPVEVGFDEFLNPTSTYYDPTLDFDENHINRIRPITSAQVGFAFDQVVVNIGDRAALDQVNFVAVPEPGTAALALLGLAGAHLATSRSRRRRRI